MIGKITVVSKASQIAYLKTEYLSAGADKSHFLGQGAEALGLTTQTDVAVLSLCGGKHPTTGKKIIKGRPAGGRRAGWEFSFSADKTISLAWAFGDASTQAIIEEAHSKAVERAVAVAESFLDIRTTTKDAGRIREPAKAVFARYGHRSSREGDPQVHDHIFAQNLGQRPDGSWAALSTERLFASKEVAGQAYQAALFEELAARGLAVEKRETLPTETGEETFTATVIPSLDKHVEAYSKRRQQIEADLKSSGKKGAAAAQKAALKTRKKKNEPPLEESKAAWKLAAPLTEEETRNCVYGPAIKASEEAKTVGQIVDDLVAKTAKTKSVLTEADLGKYVAKNLAPYTDDKGIMAAIEEAKKHPSLVFGGQDEMTGQKKYISTTVLRMEAVMTKRLDEMAARPHQLSKYAFSHALRESERLGVKLSVEQENAARYALLETGGLAVWEGFAGAGKTTSLKVVADAYKLDGYEVFGCSKAAVAAKKLGADAKIKNVSTVDGLIRDLENGSKKLAEKSVIVVDEAGMLDTHSAARLVQLAHEAKAKIILVGDSIQLQPIGQGGCFTYAATKTAFALTDNRRQTKEQDRLDALVFRKGTTVEIKSVFDRWKNEGRLIVESTVKEAALAAANDFLNEDLPYDKKILMAETRATVAVMNAFIQAERTRKGETGDTYSLRLAPTESKGETPTPIYENISMAVGDRITFCKNSTPKNGIIDPDTGKRTQVHNGDSGVLTGLKRDGEAWLLEAKLDDGRAVAFRTDRYDRVNLGYSSTIHKCQGQSVEKAFAVSLRPDRHSQYVTQTRHKITSKTYSTGEAIEGLAKASTRENKAVLASQIVTEYRVRMEAELAARAARLVAQQQAEAEQKAEMERQKVAKEKAETLTQKSPTAEAKQVEPPRARKKQKEQDLGLSM